MSPSSLDGDRSNYGRENMTETAADLRFRGVKPEFLPEVVPKSHYGRTGY